MKTKKVKIKDLKIDPKLTEIRHINPVFVSRYRQVYRTTPEVMPPLIVQKGTNRVVSGNHRLSAMLKEFSEDYKTGVIEKEYGSEKQVLEDFAKENASHGNALDSFTKSKLIGALSEHGVTPEEISRIFNIPVKSIEKFGEGKIRVEIGNNKFEDRPVKRGFEPDPEKPITKEQYDTHSKRDRGFHIAQMTGQIGRWLSQDLVVCNSNNLCAIKKLQTEIEGYLKRHEKEIKKIEKKE